MLKTTFDLRATVDSSSFSGEFGHFKMPEESGGHLRSLGGDDDDVDLCSSSWNTCQPCDRTYCNITEIKERKFEKVNDFCVTELSTIVNDSEVVSDLLKMSDDNAQKSVHVVVSNLFHYN